MTTTSITGHVFIATSLDGFVARNTDNPETKLDWLMKQDTVGEDHGYDDFIESVDGLVMGRGSFETLLGFEGWPYGKPVIVVSQSLTKSDIPDELSDKVELVKETADVLYHLLVLLRSEGIMLEDIMMELQKRTSQSGLEEKASR
jgi:dihydrofolate reductase